MDDEVWSGYRAAGLFLLTDRPTDKVRWKRLMDGCTRRAPTGLW